MAVANAFALLVAAGILLCSLPAAVGDQAPAAPTALHGSYDANSDSVALGWTASSGGAASYVVYRDNSRVGTTTSPTFKDVQVPQNTALVYFVTAVGQDGSASSPAVTVVPTLSCELVSVETSWSWPYVYVHTHEECLGGTVTFDKDVTWVAR